MDAQIQGQDTEYKPWGLTAGAMVGTRQADTDAANLLALRGSQLGNVVKQKDAMVAQGQMDNPEWLKQKLAGEMGQGQSLAATGKVDTALADSKIKSGIAEHLAKASKAQVEQELSQVQATDLALDKLMAAGEATGYSGMQFEYGASEIVNQIGADPAMIQRFLGTPPEGRAAMLKALKTSTQKTLTFVPQVLQKMEEQRQKGVIDESIHAGDRRSREKVSAADNATRTSVEQMGIDAGKYKRGGSGVSVTTVFAKMTPQARLGAVQKVLTTGVDPETNELLTEMARAGYEAMYSQDKRTVDASNASRTTGKIDTPAVAGMPTATPPSVGDGGAKPVSGGGQTKSGVKYKVVN